MAKQLTCFITGTFDDLCFYKMDGNYYVRVKSSLTAKKVKTNKAFIKTMESAKQLATASVMASKIYRTLDKEKRKVQWYRKITGMAKLLLKEGVSEQDIINTLTGYATSMVQAPVLASKPKPAKTFISPSPVKSFMLMPTSKNGKIRSYEKLARSNKWKILPKALLKYGINL